MKFGKEFASQMVPEWHEAYMDYNFLKQQIAEIHAFKQRNKPVPSSVPENILKRNHTLHRAFSGLTHFARHNHNHNHDPKASHDLEMNQVILVHPNGVEGSHETTFLKAGEAGGEYELVYFRRLDDEFNKVLKFYKSKAEEVMKEAEVLNKQMEAFIAFRVRVEHPDGWTNCSEETKTLAKDVATARAELLAATPSAAMRSRRAAVDVIEEENSVNMRKAEADDESDDSQHGNETKPIINHEIQEQKKSEFRARRPAHLEILESVRFNTVEASTPRSTIKNFLKLPVKTDLKFTKDNLRKAEVQLIKAFVEFYHKLRLLKSYSFLNVLAFSKIMKKYDEVTSRNASKSYMKIVDDSYLGSSDEVGKLMERVEETFIKHFTNSNRSKGMNLLRPRKRQERHRVTFSTGFLVGCTVSLLLALVLVIRARKILDNNNEGREIYMETMFPLYSLFGFIVLHMLFYAGNVFFWRRYRVNYSFIFGFKPGTELGYREVLLLSFCISVLALASVLANLDMEMDPRTLDYQAVTELLPLVLVLLIVAIMLCPLNIVYRSSRYFLLVTLVHAVLAPLYKVTLPDFLLADQLTSQVQALRSIQFYICYYGWGDYRHRQNSCERSAVFNTFSFILAGVPFWLRFCQCMRRLYDEKDAMQGYNGIKYFLTIVAVCARTAYTLQHGESWWYVALMTSILAGILLTYWDIVYDWGLLQLKSKNFLLRDKLLVQNKSIYYAAIVLNVLLRFAWIQTIMDFTVFSLHTQAMTALVACLEIIRRGVWNFFRLENEHLNNVGKFRAFKTVPMPFNYDEDEDKDD